MERFSRIHLVLATLTVAELVTLAWRTLTAFRHQWCVGEDATAERLSKHCDTNGFPLWQISGEIFEAWASARMKQDEQIELDDVIENRISSWEHDFTAELLTPYWYALSAETRLMRRKVERASKQ
jgi:hypothetical protein